MAKKKRDEPEVLYLPLCNHHQSTWHNENRGCDLARAEAAEAELAEVYEIVRHVLEAPPTMYANERGYLKLAGEILELRDHT